MVLDLDDTLVCTFRKDFAPYHIRHGLGSAARLTCHELHYGKGEAIDSPITGEVLVVERPDLLEFLRSIKSFADIVLFTAGIESVSCAALFYLAIALI